MLAAQFYTLRESTKTREGFEDALARVAAIGYQGVQLSAVGCMNGTDPEVSAEHARGLLDKFGLKCVATHRPVEALRDEVAKEIAFHEALGCTYTAIGGVRWPYGASPSSYRQFLSDFAPSVSKLKASGIRFGVHNHDYEFQKDPESGGLCYDILIDAGQDIQLEVDTYWVQHAGLDPVSLLSRIPGRIAAVHLKDKEVVEGAGPVMAPVGEGNLDWPAIIEACKGGGTEYLIVEQDECRRDPFDCLRSSYEYLHGLGL